MRVSDTEAQNIQTGELPLALSPSDWCITRDRFVAEEDGLYESLFALTNGRAGVRATVDFEAGGGVPACFFLTSTATPSPSKVK